MLDANSFTRSFRVQLRVIGALLMREVLTRYGRHNIGFLWLFVEPMLFTLGVTALWSIAKATHGTTIPIVAFAVTGYSTVLVWRNMPSRCVRAIEANLGLLYHRNVKIFDIFAARVILEASGATISFISLCLLFTFIGMMDPPQDILKVLVGWFMLIWFGAALGFLIGAVSERSEILEKLWHPTSYILFPLSGAAFMVDHLPKAAQKVILVLPMVHGVEVLRDGYFGSKVRTHYSVMYMALFCLCLTVVALVQERIVSKEVVPE